MRKIDTLVVGQGIAGSLIAFMLHRNNVPFMVIDPGQINTSSRIAAGMFTPVSGKRKTIQPLTLQQIPFAIDVYLQMEQLLGTAFLHLQNIYQVHYSPLEQHELNAKLETAGFATYILAAPVALPNLKQPFGAFEITGSGWVDCESMLNAFTKWLLQNDALIQAGFLYQDLQVDSDRMEYHGMHFNNIIFCEGYRAVDNPFFKSEKIIPCKGDMLTIKYDHPVANRVIKKNGIYLIPAAKNTFRAGATYRWHNSNAEPDEADKNVIEHGLDEMLENKYTTIDQKSGIRPTTESRTVIAKRHDRHPGMFMLNGLGTKGILHGPWWAEYITAILLDGRQIAGNKI